MRCAMASWRSLVFNQVRNRVDETDLFIRASEGLRLTERNGHECLAALKVSQIERDIIEPGINAIHRAPY